MTGAESCPPSAIAKRHHKGWHGRETQDASGHTAEEGLDGTFLMCPHHNHIRTHMIRVGDDGFRGPRFNDFERCALF